MSRRRRLIKADTIRPADDPVVAAAEYADASIASDLQDAFAALGDQIDQAAIQRAIAAHNYTAIMDLIPQGQLSEDLSAALTRLVEVAQETAALSVEALAAQSEIRISFDHLAPQFTQLMVDMRTNLIQGMTSDAQATLQAIIVDGYQRGVGVDEIARNIRGMISLGEQRAQAVLNYQAALQSGSSRALDYVLRDARFDGAVARAMDGGIDIPADKIDRMVARYAERQLASRARTIARTESLRAANVGQRAGYQQMVDKGLLDKDAVTRRWLVAIDEVTCEVCQSIPDMNPDGVGMDEQFDSLDGPVMDPPDPHPNCRCGVLYHIPANAISKGASPVRMAAPVRMVAQLADPNEIAEINESEEWDALAQIGKGYNPDEPRDERGRWRQSQAEARMGTDRLTERYRVMVRGDERQFAERRQAQLAAPDREERRVLAGLPGAKFDEQGNLSNVEEMRAVRAARDAARART